MKPNMVSAKVALAAVPFMMVLGNSMLIPILPDIRKALGISEFQSGLLITAFSIPAAIAILVAGVLSDRVGRKKVIIPSLVIYGAGGVLAGMAALVVASPFPLILAARVLQGIGAAGTAPVAMALAGDIFATGERSKVMGALEASNGMGKVVSPIVGATLGLLAWWAPFFAYGALALPSAVGVAYMTSEPGDRTSVNTAPIGTALHELWMHLRPQLPTLLSALFTGFVVLLNLFGILFYLSNSLESAYGLHGIRKGLALAGPVLVMALTSYMTGVFLQTHRVFLKLISSLGLFVVCAALILVASMPGSVPLYVGVTLAGVGNGLVLPSLNLLVTSAVEMRERGLVTSVYGSVRFLGVALGPPAFGYANRYGAATMFVVAVALSSFAAIVALAFMRPGAKPPQKTGGSCLSDQALASEIDEGSAADDRGHTVALYLGCDGF